MPLKDKTNILMGKMILIAGKHKFTNLLNTKLKKERLNLQNR